MNQQGELLKLEHKKENHRASFHQFNPLIPEMLQVTPKWHMRFDIQKLSINDSDMKSNFSNHFCTDYKHFTSKKSCILAQSRNFSETESAD